MKTTVRSLGVIVGMLALSGCFSTPQTEGGMYAGTDYWTRYAVPPLEGKVQRVAIADFSVEFVTARYRKGIEVAGAARFDPTQFTPIGAALSVLGLGRRITDFDEELMKELPTSLYADFVKALEARGVTVVPVGEVTGTNAYTHYKRYSEDSSSAIEYVNPVGSDTGRIRATKIFPAEGLQVVAGAVQGDVVDIDAGVLNAVGCDLVIRARFRVGLFEGKASIERGSEIYLTGKGIMGHLMSDRSLLSRESVQVGKSFAPIRGNKYEVDSVAYRDAMKPLFEQYLELAFDSRR